MKISQRYLLFIILSATVGAVFIFSAYAKTSPIDDFTNIVFNRVAISWKLASGIARFFIGLEAAVGVLLLFHVYGRSRWVLWLTLFILIIFSGYLVGLWFTDGNDVDCGCMGNVLPMTPLWSLVKNAILIAIVSVLLAFDKKQKNNSFPVTLIVAALIIVIPFVAFPNKLPLHIMYDGNKNTHPKDDLRTNKHLIAFMSLTCPHCKAAAVKLDTLRMQDPALPIHIVFMDRPDRDSLFSIFQAETQIHNVPYDFIDEKKFMQLAGAFVPALYLMNGEIVDNRIEPSQLNKSLLDNWLKE